MQDEGLLDPESYVYNFLSRPTLAIICHEKKFGMAECLTIYTYSDPEKIFTISWHKTKLHSYIYINITGP